jgi:hypothetical protein
MVAAANLGRALAFRTHPEIVSQHNVSLANEFAVPFAEPIRPVVWDEDRRRVRTKTRSMRDHEDVSGFPRPDGRAVQKMDEPTRMRSLKSGILAAAHKAEWQLNPSILYLTRARLRLGGAIVPGNRREKPHCIV